MTVSTSIRARLGSCMLVQLQRGGVAECQQYWQHAAPVLLQG